MLNPDNFPDSGTIEEELEEIENAKRQVSAENIVKDHTIIAMSFAIMPVAIFDLALLVGNQIRMAYNLSTLYRFPLKRVEPSPLSPL